MFWQCPIELMSMTLNQAQGSGPRTGVYNFNLSFFGNTLISSPNSSGSRFVSLCDCRTVITLPCHAGYFGMPDKCQYERNQTVLAFFNDTTKRVTFQILATTSDYTYCSYPSFSNAQRGTLPGQRCTGVWPLFVLSQSRLPLSLSPRRRARATRSWSGRGSRVCSSCPRRPTAATQWTSPSPSPTRYSDPAAGPTTHIPAARPPSLPK
jgi:hypothetical protein